MRGASNGHAAHSEALGAGKAMSTVIRMVQRDHGRHVQQLCMLDARDDDNEARS
jgi:hypothetical protein